MKSKNIASLFMAKSKRVDSIVIVRSLLLVTIFAVGIISSMGSLNRVAETAANIIDDNIERREAATPHLSIEKAAKDAKKSAPQMDNATLNKETNRISNEHEKLEKEKNAIVKKYPNNMPGSPYPGTDEKKYQTLKKKIAILDIELDVYTGEEVKRGERYDGCFTPDTKILMADGTLKNISDVAVGDILKSYNEETGSLVTTEVVKTYEFNQNHYYLVNKSIKITAKHTFLTDKGWKRVCDLKVGDKIKSQGKFIEIGSIDLIAPLDIKVYNLGVDNHHSFLVSDGVDPYVVHNCGDGDGDGDGDITK